MLSLGKTCYNSRPTQPTAHAECFSISIIHQTNMDSKIFNMHTDVNTCGCTRGCMRTVRESALEADSERKIPCCTREMNQHQRRAGLMLYQLSYIPIPIVEKESRSPSAEKIYSYQWFSLLGWSGSEYSFPRFACYRRFCLSSFCLCTGTICAGWQLFSLCACHSTYFSDFMGIRKGANSNMSFTVHHGHSKNKNCGKKN